MKTQKLHFETLDFDSYIRNALEEDLRIQIEDHLLICDACLKRYTDEIEATLQHAEDNALIAPDFTRKTMSKIKNNEKRKVFKNNNAFIYYVAVASITVLFFNFGVFHFFLNNPTPIYDSKVYFEEKAQEKPIINYGWSEKLMDTTVNILDKIR